MEGKTTKHMRITERFVWIGVGLAGLFWILESSIHVFVFQDADFIQQMRTVQPRELWMRSNVVVLFVVFGIYAQLIIIQRKRAEDLLHRSEQELRIRNQIANIFLAFPDDGIYAEVLQVILDATKSKWGSRICR